jgi:hypothetical protein
VPGVTVPALAADEERVDALRPLVARFVRMTGKRVQLRRFEVAAVEADIAGRTIDLRSPAVQFAQPKQSDAGPRHASGPGPEN